MAHNLLLAYVSTEISSHLFHDSHCNADELFIVLLALSPLAPWIVRRWNDGQAIVALYIGVGPSQNGQNRRRRCKPRRASATCDASQSVGWADLIDRPRQRRRRDFCISLGL